MSQDDRNPYPRGGEDPRPWWFRNFLLVEFNPLKKLVEALDDEFQQGRGISRRWRAIAVFVGAAAAGLAVVIQLYVSLSGRG